MKIYFSWRTTVICLFLILGMLRAAVWQWERHQAKVAYIDTLRARLEFEPAPIGKLISEIKDPEDIIHRRVLVKGEFDYGREVVLRNRRYQDEPGVHVLTPLKIESTSSYVLVDRGFIPLANSSRKERATFRAQKDTEFVGLVKAQAIPRMFAPKDPDTGADKPWVDAWLRVDLAKISKQLPYELLPFYLETVTTSSTAETVKNIIKDRNGREELLVLHLPRRINAGSDSGNTHVAFPVPLPDTVIPPGRHLGYVYEWTFMALLTALGGIALQLRPRQGVLYGRAKNEYMPVSNSIRNLETENPGP